MGLCMRDAAYKDGSDALRVVIAVDAEKLCAESKSW